MRTKSALLLVIALGCGVVASVAVSQVVLDQKNRGEVQTVGILVVSKDLSAATRIPADGFRVEQWQVDRVPPGALTDPKMVESKFTKQRLYAGEPIIEAKLSSKGKEFSVPMGYRIFDCPVKDASGGGGYIGPGDHVDVFGYFDKGARIIAAKSVKVMENLEVVMIDGVAVVDPEATSQKKSTTIQLLVKDSQYIVLDTAANLGNLRLALRPPEKTGTSGNKLDDGESFMSWLKESDAQRVERSISPIAPAVVEPMIAKGPDLGEQHEMMIVSTSKSTKYKWINGQMVAQNSKPNEETQSTGSAQFQSYQSTPSSKSPPSTTHDSQLSSPVDPANSVQPNMTWDPKNGAWQSGGFKATYPNSK